MREPTTVEAELRVRVAINVRRVRLAENLTLKQLAAESRVHWRHLQKIEAAEISITVLTLVRLAEGLHVDASVLLAKPAKRSEPPLLVH